MDRDNGAPMKSYTLKAKLEVLGVLSSYSRPRVSNDNPFSEAQFRTLKYRSNYPQDGFKSIDEARESDIETLLNKLANEGEDKTFIHIKNNILRITKL